MYGYRQIAGECVDCMTWQEAFDVAITYAFASDYKYKVQGDYIQHHRGKNVARERQYCWKVEALGEPVGNQRSKGKARSN